jgi:hypothetical protein
MVLVRGGSVLLTIITLGLVALSQSAQSSGRNPARPVTADPSPHDRPAAAGGQGESLTHSVAESRNRLLNASQTYRLSLEKLMVLQTQDVERARLQFSRNQKLLEMGLIPRRQIETSEEELKDAISRQTETARQIESIDHLVAEVHAADISTSTASHTALSAGAPLIRHIGNSRWSMADSTRIDAFYRLKFGRALPVSAYGQTETHQRLGFDHQEAIDVAIHPDSVEGRELILYLQSQGISFIAIREAIAGSATGAHIHIGPPSRRRSFIR